MAQAISGRPLIAVTRVWFQESAHEICGQIGNWTGLKPCTSASPCLICIHPSNDPYWLRHCATSRKVADSIPDELLRFNFWMPPATGCLWLLSSGVYDPCHRVSYDPCHRVFMTPANGCLWPLPTGVYDPCHRVSYDPCHRVSYDPCHRGFMTPANGCLWPLSPSVLWPLPTGVYDPCHRVSTQLHVINKQ